MGLADEVKIHVEPGLYELFIGAIPDWMTPKELVNAGYNVALDYVPFISSDGLSPGESCDEYYNRSHLVTQGLLLAREARGGNVLFVTDGAALDTCTRQATGGLTRSLSDMIAVAQPVTCCAMVAMQETRSPVRVTGAKRGGGGVKWRLVVPPVPPMTHGMNDPWDWKMLTGRKKT